MNEEKMNELLEELADEDVSNEPLTIEEITDQLINVGLRLTRVEEGMSQLFQMVGGLAGIMLNKRNARRGGNGVYAGKPGRGRG